MPRWKDPHKDGIKIFLDLDGVVADFDRHLKDQGKLLPDGKTNWNGLDFAWWSSMPAFDGAKEFYDDLTRLAPVTFLTAPVPSADCFGGKAAWVQKLVPEEGRWILLDLVISRIKDDFANPKAILIDDREKNIEAWVKAGGIGIHHTGDFTATLAKVKTEIAKMTPATGFNAGAKPPKPAR